MLTLHLDQQRADSLQQRHPDRLVVDEGARAVDRIEHPAKPVRSPLLAELFAEDGVGRTFAREAVADHRFRRFVSLRHGRPIALCPNREVRRAKVPHRDLVRGIGERQRECQVGVQRRRE